MKRASAEIKNHRWLAVLLVFWLALAGGCWKGAPMREINHISYQLISGSILPELRQSEQYLITHEGVTLTRAGLAPGTQMQEGTWEYSADPHALQDLFDQISGVDCAKLKRVEPADAPDGGTTEVIQLVYADGSKCELLLNPGVTYTHSEDLLSAVREFMRLFLAAE